MTLSSPKKQVKPLPLEGIRPPRELDSLLARRRVQTWWLILGILLLFGGIIGFVIHYQLVDEIAKGWQGILFGSGIILGTYLMLTKNMSLYNIKALTDDDYIELAEWYEIYPDVQEHVSRIRGQGRPVISYDYQIIQDWVAEQEELQRPELTKLARQLINGDSPSSSKKG